MILPHSDHLVDGLDRGKALPLTLLDLLRVTAALGDCVAFQLATQDTFTMGGGLLDKGGEVGNYEVR